MIPLIPNSIVSGSESAYCLKSLKFAAFHNRSPLLTMLIAVVTFRGGTECAIRLKPTLHASTYNQP